MRFITTTSALEEIDYDGDCSYAVIDIDEEEKAAILARRELFKMVKSKASDIEDMRFSDSTPEFYDYLLNDEKDAPDWLVALEEKRSARFDGELEIVGTEQSVDVCLLVLEEDQFYWTASPKYTSVYVSTEPIKYERLLEGA
jgi:hypothetical protein